MVTLRRAGADDAARLWEWRNDPVTRAQSWSSEPVPSEVHDTWLAETLRRSDVALFIALDEASGAPIGTGRLDVAPEGIELSLTVAPDQRGRGYAAPLIRRLMGEAAMTSPGVRLTARSKSGNLASQRAFAASGFVAVLERDGVCECAARAYPGSEQDAVRLSCRVDAGPTAGLGHLQRTLALAAAAAVVGVRCTFRVPAEAATRVRTEGFAVDASAAADRSDGVLVDSYHVDSKDLAAWAAAGRVIVLDDTASMPLPADIVINSAPHAERLPYARLAPGATHLLGPSFALLRPEFADVAVRPAEASICRVLVMAGGGNALATLDAMIAGADAVDGEFEIDAVVGPFAPSVWAPARSPRHRVTIVRGPRSLQPLMMRADVAVTAAGQALYELAATGTPSVSVVITDNQAANASGFSEAGTTLVVPTREPGRLVEPIAAGLAALGDRGRRMTMAAAGRRLVDGRGAGRVATTLATLLRGRRGVARA
jgi:spore coat polysaccharide biosynthesis predicted glycosyltransferase SpsG/RimJ/RimL family protein N-acetyltransferase